MKGSIKYLILIALITGSCQQETQDKLIEVEHTQDESQLGIWPLGTQGSSQFFTGEAIITPYMHPIAFTIRLLVM